MGNAPSSRSAVSSVEALTSSPRLKPGDSLHSLDSERTSGLG